MGKARGALRLLGPDKEPNWKGCSETPDSSDRHKAGSRCFKGESSRDKTKARHQSGSQEKLGWGGPHPPVHWAGAVPSSRAAAPALPRNLLTQVQPEPQPGLPLAGDSLPQPLAARLGLTSPGKKEEKKTRAPRHEISALRYLTQPCPSPAPTDGCCSSRCPSVRI